MLRIRWFIPPPQQLRYENRILTVCTDNDVALDSTFLLGLGDILYIVTRWKRMAPQLTILKL